MKTFSKSSTLLLSTSSHRLYSSSIGKYGGYIEDAQLSLLGLEIFQELKGSKSFPCRDFVIPNDSNEWPSNLWGYKLGVAVHKNLVSDEQKKININEELISKISEYCKSEGTIQITDNNTIKSAVQKSLNNKLKVPKKSAVLVPICNRQGQGSILYTLRSQHVGTHKGQVSFPGGHIQDSETAIEAAIRETYEEIGETIGPIRILGVCQTVPAITGTLVTPVLGFIERDIENMNHLKLNESEVAKVFTRSIYQLSNPEYRTYEKRSGDKAPPDLLLPRYGNPKGGEHGEGENIWGLTAWITDEVLKKAVLPFVKFY